MVKIKQLNAILNDGEVLKTTDNFAVYGLRTSGKIKSNFYGVKYHGLQLVITAKRNPADVYLYYVINDMKTSAGLMIKEQLKNGYIHKIAYSLEQSIKEVAELEEFILKISETIKKNQQK